MISPANSRNRRNPATPQRSNECGRLLPLSRHSSPARVRRGTASDHTPRNCISFGWSWYLAASLLATDGSVEKNLAEEVGAAFVKLGKIARRPTLSRLGEDEPVDFFGHASVL